MFFYLVMCLAFLACSICGLIYGPQNFTIILFAFVAGSCYQEFKQEVRAKLKDKKNANKDN